MSGHAMSNLQIRILSSAFMAAVVLWLAWLGGMPFRVLCALISGAILYEWTRMVRLSAGRPTGFLAEALMLVLMLGLILGFSSKILLLAGAAAVLVLVIVSALRGAGQWEAGGLAYAALSGFALAFLRGGSHPGFVAMLFLFAVVWATDIFAYFVGRAVGGPKLAPAISPGKTRSGALGGAVGGVVAGLLLIAAADGGRLALMAAVALVLSIVSQAGDLFESWVKRRHGCKDSSALIPGHGGVMDRVDGLVAAALALYLMGWFSASAEHAARGLFPV
jgi:phosphatidate cytidylyltransferase